MHPPTMAAAVFPRPTWCLTPGAAAYDNQPTLWATVLCGSAGIGAPWQPLSAIYVTTCRYMLWVVVTYCVLLCKLASKHAPSDHGGRLPSHRLGSLHANGCFFASADSRHHGGMMRVGGVSTEGGIGAGGEVFCSIMVAAVVLRPPQGPTPGAEAYNNQPTC